MSLRLTLEDMVKKKKSKLEKNNVGFCYVEWPLTQNSEDQKILFIYLFIA